MSRDDLSDVSDSGVTKRVPATQRRAKGVEPRFGGGGAVRASDDVALLDESGAVIDAIPNRVAESLRYMLGRLRIADEGDIPERFGLTSASSGEGVTFLCRSIGVLLAHDFGRRVCVVDVNWWSPSWPSEDGAVGLADVLREDLSVDDVLMTTGNHGLALLPAGSANIGERAVLARLPELEKVLVELSESYDHIVLDIPPVNANSEALILAERSGALALVVQHHDTTLDQVKSALDEVGGVPFMGVILNKTTTKVPRPIRRWLPS
jgi:Mrp family chromosome partitioning ATPase